MDDDVSQEVNQRHHSFDDIQILLHEYESLRSESLRTIDHRNNSITISYGLIGLIITALSALGRSDGFALEVTVIFCIVIPFICFLTAETWIIEYNRMRRAGHFLSGLERRINALARESQHQPLLRWEHIGVKASHTKRGYVIQVVSFYILSSLSFAHGLYIIDLKSLPIGINEHYIFKDALNFGEQNKLFIVIAFTLIMGLCAFYAAKEVLHNRYAKAKDDVTINPRTNPVTIIVSSTNEHDKSPKRRFSTRISHVNSLMILLILVCFMGAIIYYRVYILDSHIIIDVKNISMDSSQEPA